MNFSKIKKLMGIVGKEESQAAKAALKLRQVEPEHFKNSIAKASDLNPNIKKMTTDYTPEELQKMKLLLTEDDLSGYAVKPDGELTNLFSGAKGRGSQLVDHSIEQGATKLDHFDTPVLNNLYDSKGFSEYKREPNWTEGEPDVVFRRLFAKKKD